MKKPKVYLVHGVFMHGIVMSYMRVQLEKRGYDVEIFSYRSVHNTLSENAQELASFVKESSDADDVCHFVGHSLGGLLIRLTYEVAPEIFTGKVATLGTPHNGSHVANRIADDIHQAILGGAYENALDGDLPEWTGKVPLGSLAGTSCIGLGWAIRDLPRPNDGTVSVAETQLVNQTDHVEIESSHTMLVYSKRVVKQVDNFLQIGKFIHKKEEKV